MNYPKHTFSCRDGDQDQDTRKFFFKMSLQAFRLIIHPSITLSNTQNIQKSFKVQKIFKKNTSLETLLLNCRFYL
jgi:hypothetical protein